MTAKIKPLSQRQGDVKDVTNVDVVHEHRNAFRRGSPSSENSSDCGEGESKSTVSTLRRRPSPSQSSDDDDEEIIHIDVKGKLGRDAFKRGDNMTSWYSLARLILFGFGLFVIPLRLVALAATLFLYWLYLKLSILVHKIGIVNDRQFSQLAQLVARPGAYFLLFCFSVFGNIKRYRVTEEQMQEILDQYCDKMLEPGEEESEEERKLMERNKSKPPYIVVSNHVSVLDPAVLIHELGELSFIAKQDVEEAPIISILAKQLKCLFVGPKSRGTIISRIIQRVKTYYDDPYEYNRLLIFPEATTTNGSYMIRFHEGAFIPGVPVQPVVMVFPWKNFNAAWCTVGESEPLYFLHLLSQFWQDIEVVHFPPYYPSRAERTNSKLFAENVRKLMVHAANLHLPKTRPLHLSNERFERHLKEKRAKVKKETAVTSEEKLQ